MVVHIPQYKIKIDNIDEVFIADSALFLNVTNLKIKWRLIIDLSNPRGHSVNDIIPKTLCSLSYITVDDDV